MTLRRTLTFAALGFAVAAAAQAQTSTENRDADALAADMRILAANPRDIEALITAGELTLRMGDSTASATFFGRAEKLDPNNSRIKAGWGSLLVRAERPGEALLKFQDAERRGLDPRRFAADRGLAYDLIGEQDRAQRDYRLALANGGDDEVTRRYALSLAISGNRDEAMRLLDPLLRRSDRAAWRDRAFILAMTGDTAGAEKIAATMMSPGLGAGLTPFFRKLPNLSATDRAFAVNFGELQVTPERIADARMVPPLPRLGPDPYAPRPAVVLAPAVAMAAEDQGRKRKRRKKDGLAPAVPAPAVATPVEVALAPPVYPSTGAAPTPSPAPVRVAPTPAPVPPPVRVAATPSRDRAPVVTAGRTPMPAPLPTPSPLPPPVVVVAAPSPPPAVVPPPQNPAPTPPIAVVAATPVAVPAADPVPGVADQPSAAEAGVPEPTATARVSEDTVLARIVANLDKPAVATPRPRRIPAPAAPKIEEAAPVVLATAEPRKRGKSARDQLADEQPAAGRDKLADARSTRAKPAKDDQPALDKNGCPIPDKPVAKGRGSSRTKAAVVTPRARTSDAKCKAIAAKDKEAAATKGEPARAWVQVAGGANESDLRKAWAALQAKAPDLFRGRQGWTTPLRATNRVLTGPFKSADEAQDFVNRMAKAGLSGFVFTSAKGQKVERLGAK